MEQNVEITAPPHPHIRATARLLTEASRPARRARYLRKLATFGVLASLAAAAYWLAPLFYKPEPPRRTLAVRYHPMASVLHEIGSISAHIERPILARFTGEITWRAEDGAHVEAGDPVVTFDSKAQQDDIETGEKDLLDRRDIVRQYEEAIETTKRRYSYVIRQREIDLEKAQIARNKAFNFPRPDDLLDVELTWKTTELDMKLCQLQTTSMEVLTHQGFNSEAALRKQQSQLANTKVEHARAKMIYDLTRQGTTPDLKRVSELAVADALKSLNVAKFNREADLATGQAALDLAKLGLEDFERDFARRKQHLDAATVRAPVRGRVIFQSSYKFSRPVQVGETREEGTDLCTLLDTSQLVVTLSINEMDIGGVKLGQRATIALPALPGRTFEAEVSEIAVTAQDKNVALSWLALRRSGEAFVNVVRVKLVFINLPEEVKNHIRVGFTADVKLNLGSAAKALCVPWQAVGLAQDGTPFADALVAGKLERRVLKLGRSDNDCVEVLEGLAENMHVLDRSNAVIPLREQEVPGAPAQPALESMSAPRVSEERP